MVRIKTLLNLLSSAVAILALALILPYLAPWVTGMACAGVLGGFWCDRRERYPLNPTVATLIALAGILFNAAQITRADVATPVAHALILLLVIRLLTPKEPRDYLQIFVLALFLLAGSSLISLDMGLGFSFLVYLVLMIFSVILGLVLLTVFVTDKRLALPRADLYKLIKVSLIMPVVSLLLMVVFFFVMPRTRHPLWNFLNPGGTAKTGLAESVQPGAYAGIAAVKNLVFRADVEELAPEDLYWRALVLNQPDDKRWVRTDPPREKPRVVQGRRTVEVTIYPEARSDRYLVTLDKPLTLSGIRHERSDDYVFVARASLNHPYSLKQMSSLDANLEVDGALDRAFYLTLPAALSARMQALAEGIVSRASTGPERVTALADFFRNQQLTYAQDDLPGGDDPLDAFLFDAKRGYCEFFASAYVTLARLSGIPARLVGGYYGGTYNPLGGYYLVTEDTAHVWVEILSDDNRWVRIDPSQWAINAGATFAQRRAEALGPLQRVVDSLNYRWVQAVLLFDFNRQLQVFRETRMQLRELEIPEGSAWHGLWLGGVLVVLLVGWQVWKRPRLSVEARILGEFRARVRKRYGERAAPLSAGLSELAEQLDNAPCREFAAIYQGAVFRDRALSASEQARLKELLREI